jgi:hypothetical protein
LLTVNKKIMAAAVANLAIKTTPVELNINTDHVITHRFDPEQLARTWTTTS